MESNKRKDLLLALAKYTKENPMPRHRVAEILGVSDRKAREELHRMKRDLIPVFSTESGGYYLAEGEDLERALEHYEKQAISILATCYRMRRLYAPDQISMGDLS